MPNRQKLDHAFRQGLGLDENRIVEDLELRTPRGIDPSKSGRKTQSWVYELKLNQYKWLVYDYRKDI